MSRTDGSMPHSRAIQDRIAILQDCRNLLDDAAAAVSTVRYPSILMGLAH